MSFSERMGYQSEPPLQFECMSSELQIEIHNVIRHFEDERYWPSGDSYSKLRQVYGYLWSHFFMLDSDVFSLNYANSGRKESKKLYDQLSWERVYDYVEEYCRLISIFHRRIYTELCDTLNAILQKNNSAYRLQEGKIMPISDETELNEISEARNTPHRAINHHMKKAVDIFSDRENKDYPNVVKEAITAVEAAVNAINKSTGKTLGDALKELNKKSTIHPALIEALNKIYGYTSNEHSGVRHAVFDGSDCIPDFADAKFMLVACSAFINYLLLKVAK